MVRLESNLFDWCFHKSNGNQQDTGTRITVVKRAEGIFSKKSLQKRNIVFLVSHLDLPKKTSASSQRPKKPTSIFWLCPSKLKKVDAMPKR